MIYIRYIYCDGACSKNGYEGSSGGYGVVEVDENNNIIQQYQNFKSPTTNNEMELMGLLTAIKWAVEQPPSGFMGPVIYCDSAYCVNIVNDWIYKWANNGWVRGKNQEIKNLNLVKEIYEYLIKYRDYNISIKKIKGHSGNQWNEYVDKLATGVIKINE